MKDKIFSGTCTALYTPITNGEIDFKELGSIIDEQIENKINAIAILGTTGECATITLSERTEIIKYSAAVIRKRIPLIVGTGSNCTKTFIELTKQAKELGADCSLAITPYYNKCNSKGLYEHFLHTDKECSFPMIIYNVPTRTGVNVTPKDYLKLAELKNVVGIKEANTDEYHVDKVFNLIGDALPVYCGSDNALDIFLSKKACGTISVASNIIPLKINDYIWNFSNYYNKKKQERDYLFQLFELLSFDVNPIPLKVILSSVKKCGYELRLPLCFPKKEHYDYIINEFKKIYFQLKGEL